MKVYGMSGSDEYEVDADDIRELTCEELGKVGQVHELRTTEGQREVRWVACVWLSRYAIGSATTCVRVIRSVGRSRSD